MENILLFAVLLPLSFGLMLFFLFYSEREQAKTVRILERWIPVAENPGSRAEEWSRLVESIVEFPQSVGPGTGSALHIYDWEEKRFELAAHWSAEEKTRFWHGDQLTQEICNSCELAKTSPPNFITCQYLMDAKKGQKTDPYCLPVINENKPTALLHIDFPIDQMLTNDQILILERIAPEMAFSIKRASVIHTEVMQMNEINGQLNTGGKAPLPHHSGDIAASLLDDARAAGDRSRFDVHFISEGEPCSLTPHVRRQILFICREAINNIEQHAHAHHVKIRLNWQVSELTVSISDDGRGFAANSTSKVRQTGLALMKERADEIKGRVSWVSSRQTGTEVTLRVPLQMVDWLPDLKTLNLGAGAWNTDAHGLSSP